MNIEAYAEIMMKLYIGLFLLSLLVGIAAVFCKIRKRTVKYWWLIPCTMLYSIVAVFNVFIAYMAYDDPADPNYGIYAEWGLRDFILSDMKVLIIFLLIVILLYLVLRRKEYKMCAKAGRRTVLVFGAVLLAAAVIWILFTVAFFPKREKAYIMMKVEGFEVSYPADGEKITLESVNAIELGSSAQEIADKLGEPDAWIGSGILRPVYFVEGKRAVVFHFTYPSALEDLKEIVVVDENGESRMIKEK